ncbi:MAG: NUDIX hydrolase [Deltaproteobacteria bacterium]|nr:NUDIX hydrolase [Deltaproteobacteria bacterium]
MRVTTPAAPRLAATIMLCRPREHGFELLFVKRHGASGFMGGAHVFPGGRIEDNDSGVPLDVAGSALPELPAAEAARVLAGAVRETKEEAGLDVDPASLRAWAHWITPEAEPKRFDTWFFLAPVPAHTVAIIDQHEAVEHAWHSPKAALAAHARGELTLMPPTLATVEDLAVFASIAEAAASVRRPLPTIRPHLIYGDQIILALPGDPLHPEKARVFPHRTRIVLHEGRFASRVVEDEQP